MTARATPFTAAADQGCPSRINRRHLLAGAAAATAGVLSYHAARRMCKSHHPVFVARDQHYRGPLARTIQDGLDAVGLDRQWVRNRTVLLKPNLVEPTREAPHLTTHPAVVVAAAEVFRQWGATVLVGEAPGHMRDTEMALIESGMGDALRGERLEFVDLNYSESTRVTNAGGVSQLKEFHFPKAVAAADLIVSMPKLKTHHWVGMTAAMKNLYGTLPGLIYGWPKNVLHYAGVPETVVDINASLPPRIAIVDGILCMEGDGPLMGSPKTMGLIAVSRNLTAADATLARIIGLDPRKIPYLALADGRLGTVDPWCIPQHGERWEDLADPFELIDTPHLAAMRV